MKTLRSILATTIPHEKETCRFDECFCGADRKRTYIEQAVLELIEEAKPEKHTYTAEDWIKLSLAAQEYALGRNESIDQYHDNLIRLVKGDQS